ncbi:MAG: aminoacyl-tRNA hydrolase [Clostridium sp.]|uniref:aminoacyl-tRNA hydrolase n=1 Tax=Clostridium sp. TaxID=1506 RepID=UPI002909F6EE|nr:aminoacyl-tRNA hydrolase [Clostridium sp.]MDU7339185.1 aminoacyl-tRNA hydrolase [Clostridium sp.]
MLKSFFSRPAVTPGPVEAIIVGLGNPGRQYEQTRHNAGFQVLDHLAESLGVKIDRLKFKGLCSEVSFGGKKVLLLKPSTFMNLSGQSVTEAMRFYKLTPEQVIVVFDDISLAPGRLRIRRKGSDGGQNGMKNIIYLSGSDAFPRVKMGIGSKPNPNWDLADWVLSTFSAQEMKSLGEAKENAIKALELMVQGKIDEAMSQYNS